MNIPERSVAMVFGYLPEIDRPFEVAAAAGLTLRIALCLDTWRGDDEGMYFDDQLAVALLGVMAASIPHDRQEVAVGEASRTWASLTEWHENYRRLPPDDRGPFDEVRLFLEGKLQAIVRTEPWVRIGGPHPYHDTWTFSAYLEQFDRVSMQAGLLAACSEQGAFVRDLMTASPEPRISLSTRMWDLFN